MELAAKKIAQAMFDEISPKKKSKALSWLTQ
jgi:hypothetical protein